MASATQSSWHAQRNSDQQHNMTDITEPKMLREENINLPSPSKSLQGTQIRRDSSNSVESIQSIKVEYESLSDARKENKKTPKTENIKSRNGGISSFLKPKFLKSRSSLTSSGSMENIIRSESNFTTKQRQSTIEDFADTSSEDENSRQYVYDAESINSILEEYQMRNSSYISPTKKNDFIFKEEFNDSSELNRSRLSSTSRTNSTRKSIHTPTLISKATQVKRNNPKSSIERTLGNRSSHSSSGNSSSPGAFYDCSKASNGTNSDSSSSSKFKIYPDKQNDGESDKRKKVDRRNIISTSSNIDVFNRTSLSNLTTISNIDFNMTDENKYPASNSSNSHRQSKRQSDNRFLFDASNNILESEYDENFDSNVLERVLRPKDRTSIFSERFPNTSQINMDETAIKNTTKDVTRSSMSTNELLYKLETFYDNDNDNNTRESISNSKESKGFYDLTAGVDSKTKLPVMLYKVQDKNYIERNNRWSVDETTQKILRSNTSPASSLQNVSQECISKPLAGSSIPLPETSKSRLGQYASTASLTLARRMLSLNSVSSQTHGSNILDEKRSSPSLRDIASSRIQSHGSITQFTPNNYLQDTLSKNNSHEHMLNNTPSTKYNAIDSSYEDLEKNDLKPPINHMPYNTHSWPLFILVMTIGLVVPPIYILIAVGFFDNNTYYRQYNQQLTYLVVNPNQNKRFSKTQKLVSFIIGLVWLCIVLAMIGVGIGIGISRES
ncbi:uncharacterized protein AC631_03778 [Debaryomyces fabryi]|uniref:Uncharacterized protein n=1 Tax=Debaryomyces fabryi TaxID=58627 RepID=A0A0V1PW91_9ASCO|nr:uncharacterized protein AC631_03778 [Debaryomyces fabryi]KSA00451.1 hypothetical protein AC631_03778 [Debaryomyces fabryi]CUM46538.1 unnamed protein product [Debaryomyces fabryi]